MIMTLSLKSQDSLPNDSILKKVNYMKVNNIFLYYSPLNNKADVVNSDYQISQYTDTKVYKNFGTHIYDNIAIRLPYICGTEFEPDKFTDTTYFYKPGDCERSIVDRNLYKGSFIRPIKIVIFEEQTIKEFNTPFECAYVRMKLKDSVYINDNLKILKFINGCLKGNLTVSFEIDKFQKVSNIKIYSLPNPSQKQYIIDRIKEIESLIPYNFRSGIGLRYYFEIEYE